MRIAMFTNNYKPYIGGVQISIEHLASALREKGHTVYVFAPSYENQEEEEYVIRYPSFPVKIAGAPIPNVLTTLFLEKVIELQIDIIHVHHPAIVGNVALNIRRKTGIPVVFTYHTRYEEYLHYLHPLDKIEENTKILNRYLKYFCNRCDMVIAPTPGIKTHLAEKEVSAPVGVLPTGIPEKNFFPEEEKSDEIRARYAGDVDYLFCTVSRLAEEKNLIFQLKALKQLKLRLDEMGKTFRHLMIGEGPQREMLQKTIEALGLTENIVLVGNVENRMIKNYQAASDLFLFTSKSETQGIVILEALAAGTPVTAVDATGVRDVVRHGENGFLTREEEDDWAGCIVAYLQDGKLREHMRREAKKTAECYNERAIAAQAEVYYLNTCINAKTSAFKMPIRKRFVV